MITLEKIREYKESYKALYSNVRREQGIDNEYINDKFPVPEIKNPHHIYRSGLGIRIIDAPAEQIVTSNPQAFFQVLKGSKDAGLKWSEVVNGVWMDILRRQNPNIFKEFNKDQLGRGEAYYKVIHNESWLGKEKTGLPVHFIVLDPMVIYASPEEDVNGIPNRILIMYERQLSDVIVRYRNWSNPKKKDGKQDKQKTATWFEYWDGEARYFEADDEAVLEGGVQKNIYGFVPFVRKYSGFGRRSPDGELSNLIVSDIKRSRDLIREECAMRSNIASIMYLFAHPTRTLMTSGSVDIDKVKTELSFGEYDINVLQQVPPDTKWDTTEITPTQETFRHHADIIQELNQRHPFIMAGFPFGSSGRQQDMTWTTAMRRYDSTVENNANATATAIEMAIKICKKLNLIPDGISKADLEADIKCVVKLKAEDPIENDRKITLGDRLYNSGNGSISLQRFHTEYQGLTEDESKKEIARMLADRITIYNPDVAAVMGMVAAQEGGMERYLEMARQRQVQQPQGLMPLQPATSQQRIQGETQTPLGQEMGVTGGRGARTPPVNYTRGR